MVTVISAGFPISYLVPCIQSSFRRISHSRMAYLRVLFKEGVLFGRVRPLLLFACVFM